MKIETVDKIGKIMRIVLAITIIGILVFVGCFYSWQQVFQLVYGTSLLLIVLFLYGHLASADRRATISLLAKWAEENNVQLPDWAYIRIRRSKEDTIWARLIGKDLYNEKEQGK